MLPGGFAKVVFKVIAKVPPVDFAREPAERSRERDNWMNMIRPGLVRSTLVPFLLLIAATASLAQENETAAVPDLQTQLNQQAERIAELQKLLDGKVDNGTSNNSVKISGRIHADYWGFPNHDAVIEGLEGGNPQDRIGFRRIRFGVAGNIAPNMNYKIEMEFALGNNSEFRDVYLGWTDLPVLGTLLLGNQKRPYGLDHLNSSRYNVFLERPFVIESFNQDCRRFGLAAYNVSDDQVYNWRYGLYNTELMQNDGQHINDHVQLEFAGRLAKTYRYEDEGRDYGHWAVSATAATVDGGSNETRFRHRAEARSVNRWLNTGRVPDADHYELLGLEYLRNKGPWQFTAEVLNLWMTTDAEETVNYHGGYVYASFFLTGDHMPWKRSSGTLDRIKPLTEFLPTADSDAEAGMGAWQIAVRWSWADFSESSQIATQTDPTAFGLQGDALTIGLNWYWNPNARMQFNWSNGDITTAANEIGRYDIVGARFMVDF
jgi:phosphate-selective porin OprO/OprP